MGGALFCLALQGVLENLQDAFPTISILAYMDDLHFAGDSDICVQAFDALSVLLGEIGLNVNLNKCKALVPTHDVATLWPDGFTTIVQSPSSGLIVLGAPIGGRQFSEDFVNQSVDNTVLEVNELVDLNLPRQCTLALIMGSMIHKPRYLLRTCQPEVTEASSARLDSHLVSLILRFADTTDERVSDNVKTQISLPRRMGGLGLGDLARSGKASYFASVIDSAKSRSGIGLEAIIDASHCPEFLQGLHQSLIDELGEVDVSWTKLWGSCEPTQRYLTNKVAGNAHSSLLGQFHTYSADAKRLSLLRGKGSFTWITAAPARHEVLTNHEFASGLKLRLGLPLTDAILDGDRVFCPCTKELVTNTLEHALACAKGSLDYYRKDRHDSIRDKLYQWIAAHRIRVEREVSLRRTDDEPEIEGRNPKRMDLVLILDNQLMWSDITVVNGNTEARRASGEQHSADVASVAKIQKYAKNVTLQGATFLPAGIESYGGLSKSFLVLIKRLVDAVCPRASRFVKARKKQELIASIEVELIKRQTRQFDVFSSTFKDFTRWVSPGEIPQFHEADVNNEVPSESQLSLTDPGPSYLGGIIDQDYTQQAHQVDDFVGILCQSDGASRNNGGPEGEKGSAGGGAVCYNVGENGSRNQLSAASYFLGTRSNNEAEYEALLIGMKLVLVALASMTNETPCKVRFQCDAQLVVDQINGAARCKKDTLKPLFERARTELFHLRNLPRVENVEVCHFSRIYNGVADNLAKTASRMPTPAAFSVLDHPPMADRPVYEIENFVDMKEDKILVQWKGFPNRDDFTWEEEIGIRSDLQDDNLFHALMQDLLVVLGLDALDEEPQNMRAGTLPIPPNERGGAGAAAPPRNSSVQVNEMTQEPLMSSVAYGRMCQQEHLQQNSETLPTGYVAAHTGERPGSTSTSCSQSANVAGPNAVNTSHVANVELPLVRRSSARVRERQARCCLSRAPSAP